MLDIIQPWILYIKSYYWKQAIKEATVIGTVSIGLPKTGKVQNIINASELIKERT